MEHQHYQQQTGNYGFNNYRGTGLTTIGAANTVLSSNGSTVSWAPVSTLITSNIGVATGTSLTLTGGIAGVISGFTTATLTTYTEATISYSSALNLFVAVGRSQTEAIGTSTDGITWVPQTLKL